MDHGFQPKHPIVKDLCNGLWELHEEVIYISPMGRVWFIPKGFLTDFGSIPKFLDWIPGLQTNGTDADNPFILHDWLYHCHRIGKDQCRNKADADNILLEAMDDSGVGYTRRHIIYTGVRLGGSIAWNRKVRINNEQHS